MHIDHEHVAGGPEHDHPHVHEHTHEHTHDGEPHTHPHTHEHTHPHEHPHEHDHVHPHEHPHDHVHPHEHPHDHGCAGSCEGCASQCSHTPMEELTALMKYMAGHNAAHARELAELANQLEKIGNHTAYEQVMAAVSDFEKGNLRLTAVLSSLDVK